MKFAVAALALVAGCSLSGCYLKAYPVTPQVAEASTYELIAGDLQGTAWVVDDHHLMTAGHMCESAPGPYVIISSTGRRATAMPVAWELSHYSLAPMSDLCLLRSDAGLAAPLILADALPEVGDPVTTVGWPDSEFRTSTGKYLGDVDGPDAHAGDFTFSAPSDHGASGSAVFTEHGVVGILVRLRVDGGYVHDGSDGSTMTPLGMIKPFLKDEGIDWQPQPALPTPPPDED